MSITNAINATRVTLFRKRKTRITSVTSCAWRYPPFRTPCCGKYPQSPLREVIKTDIIRSRQTQVKRSCDRELFKNPLQQRTFTLLAGVFAHFWRSRQKAFVLVTKCLHLFFCLLSFPFFRFSEAWGL